MHRDTNGNLYTMHFFKSMHHILNFYADALMQICEPSLTYAITVFFIF